jgi:ribonucleoside-diphosphate reductase beta chain
MHNRSTYASTNGTFDRTTPVYRLFEKSKRLGIWNPADIDFSQDKTDFANMSEIEQDWILRQIALFVTGEEAVTLDLLPLIMTVAQEGRIDEEMFLTTFLFEEAKHLDFFTRFLDEVVGDAAGDMTRFYTDSYDGIFNRALPQAMQALHSDRSPAAQVRASVTYNMVVEGVLAENGYNSWFKALRNDGNLLPGMQQGLELIRLDESRHIAYGVYFLSRHIVAEPDVWNVVEQTFGELMPLAQGLSADAAARYDNNPPFALDIEANRAFLMGQYEKRLARLQKARNSSLDEVHRTTHEIIDADDG